jgi:hypothetical protein
MAFDRNALHAVAATVGGFTLWHYRTETDGRVDLEKPDYWRDATEIRPLDRLMVDCKQQMQPAKYGMLCGTMVVGWNGRPKWLDWREIVPDLVAELNEPINLP